MRIGVAGTPLFDVLYDTTDSEPATAAFAHVVFVSFPTDWIDGLGVSVKAF